MVVAHVVGAPSAEVELEIGIVDSALVLQAFLSARAKGACHKEGPARAPGGFSKPPAWRPGGCKMLIV